MGQCLSIEDGPHYSVRALLVGINYVGTKYELKGCINDVKHMTELLRSLGYNNFTTLVEEQATYSNIITQLTKLVRESLPGDRLFFHYSGHGSHEVDDNGDEADHLDECICPIDYNKSGFIRDDTIRQILSGIPNGCQMTCLFDSCESGTICDLKYNYTKTALNGIEVIDTLELNGLPKEDMRGNIVVFSGSRDGEISTDTMVGDEVMGSMTSTFIETFNQTPKRSYESFIRSLRQNIIPRSSQVPQMSSGRLFDTSIPMNL